MQGCPFIWFGFHVIRSNLRIIIIFPACSLPHPVD
jgi:hypothetical protein